MTAPTNHWKLGLFVVISGLLAVFTVAALSSHSMRKETVRYTSFFDEAVTGLEVGSPISFRGVTIGTVAEIGIAPDHRHVAIDYDLTVPTLKQLGLSQQAEHGFTISVPKDVRVQIASTGVTGVKYVKLDFFEKAPELPPLPFEVPENNIPAIPSTLKGIEQAISRSLDRVPEILEQISSLVQRADTFMATLDNRGLADKASSVMVRADRAFDTLDKKLAGLDTQGISADARHAIAGMEDTMGDARKLMAKLDSESGLFDSVQRATDAVGDVAVGARGTGEKLDRTLDQVTEMATSMQRVADAIEQDSDMLLKGRATRSVP